MAGTVHAAEWHLIARLFSYPEQAPDEPPLCSGASGPARALAAEMRNLSPVRLQNEYTRLFINALPQVPCAPYGSVYLEGRVMGDSTVSVREIYRKYGLAPNELPDHIAVECEFLGWLHGVALNDPRAAEDYLAVLDHLKQWAPAFFDCVERHDQLGCFGRAAALARAVLLRTDAP